MVRSLTAWYIHTSTPCNCYTWDSTSIPLAAASICHPAPSTRSIPPYSLLKLCSHSSRHLTLSAHVFNFIFIYSHIRNQGRCGGLLETAEEEEEEEEDIFSLQEIAVLYGTNYSRLEGLLKSSQSILLREIGHSYRPREQRNSAIIRFHRLSYCLFCHGVCLHT